MRRVEISDDVLRLCLGGYLGFFPTDSKQARLKWWWISRRHGRVNRPVLLGLERLDLLLPFTQDTQRDGLYPPSAQTTLYLLS